jgi:hypothetical protein
MINEEQELRNQECDEYILHTKRRRFAIGGRSISGSGRFGKSVNRLIDHISVKRFYSDYRTEFCRLSR